MHCTEENVRLLTTVARDCSCQVPYQSIRSRADVTTHLYTCTWIIGTHSSSFIRLLICRGNTYISPLHMCVCVCGCVWVGVWHSPQAEPDLHRQPPTWQTLWGKTRPSFCTKLNTVVSFCHGNRNPEQLAITIRNWNCYLLFSERQSELCTFLYTTLRTVHVIIYSYIHVHTHVSCPTTWSFYTVQNQQRKNLRAAYLFWCVYITLYTTQCKSWYRSYALDRES